MSSEQEIEGMIQEAGKTAPRITPQHIDDCIVSESYFTADEAAKVGGNKIFAGTNGEIPSVMDALRCLTICVLVLRNGFTVTGESACASPENFDAEIGRRIARDNAREKVWMLEGYALKERLNLTAYPERRRS